MLPCACCCSSTDHTLRTQGVIQCPLLIHILTLALLIFPKLSSLGSILSCESYVTTWSWKYRLEAFSEKLHFILICLEHSSYHIKQNYHRLKITLYISYSYKFKASLYIYTVQATLFGLLNTNITNHLLMKGRYISWWKTSIIHLVMCLASL